MMRLSNDVTPAESSGSNPTPLEELTATQDLESQSRAVALSQPRERPPAASVPGYSIVRPIGEGAYGSVWLAREQNTGKQVAIKFYTHRRGVDWSLLNREVEKLAVLYTSRNIIGLIDVGWNADPPYYVMEYLENGSLAAFLQGGPLPVSEAIRIARSVLTALVHAHGSGILHCDLKPANVLLDADFEPRLCDFGQSRLSNEQYPALGTLFYMAPEQADLKAIPDARWDVYALGALLYHMLTGAPPYRTPENEARIRTAPTLEERLAIYRQILSESPRPVEHRSRRGVDRRLAEIVDRCLRIDPHKRYPNAQAVVQALEDRDRQRARRPLLGLGVIGPALLLIAMASVFWNAMQQAVNTARSNIVDRALESNILSAELLARSLERELDSRIISLERIASDPALRDEIISSRESNWKEHDQLWTILNRHKELNDERRSLTNRRPDASWLLTDADGFQRWRHPLPPDEDSSIDKNFAHRDYFHGQDVEYQVDEPHEGVEPIRAPHVSLAFKSVVTRQYMAALSVPIWNAERTKVIAVLSRTAHLTDLLDDYGTVIRGDNDEDVNRVIALVDRRDWKILDHPWMSPENLELLSEEQLAQLKLPFPIVDKLARSEAESQGVDRRHATVVEKHYEDSASLFDADHYGGVWLSAFAAVGRTRWTAVVQERRAEAIKPVERVQASLVKHGVVALAISCTLIPLVWYFVMRGLNDQKPLRSSWRVAGAQPAGATPSSSGS